MDLVAADIMSHPVIAARKEMTIRELIVLLEEKQISGVPVVDADDCLIGVISITDLLLLGAGTENASGFEESDFHSSPAMDEMGKTQSLLEPEEEFLDRPIPEIMSRTVITVSGQSHIGEVAARMVSNRIHRVIVVQGEKIVGIVSVTDILRALRDWRGSSGLRASSIV